jgi:hypothetical protein
MDMNNKQQNAIDAANTVVTLMQQAKTLAEGIDAFLAKDGDENYLATWALLPTAAQIADGSIGTNDASPVATNPITVPAGSPLYRSKNQLANGRQLLVDLKAFLTNSAVTTQARRSWINDLLG